MRAVIQCVRKADVSVNGGEARAIGPGIVILLGVKDTDTLDIVPKLAEKCANLRVFPDEEGKLNKSAVDLGYSALVVSNFTLYGDCRKGKRPNFMAAGQPEAAQRLYEYFVRQCRERGAPVETGHFGAHMEIDMQADGPVTIWMDTDEMRKGQKRI